MVKNSSTKSSYQREWLALKLRRKYVESIPLWQAILYVAGLVNDRARVVTLIDFILAICSAFSDRLDIWRGCERSRWSATPGVPENESRRILPLTADDLRLASLVGHRRKLIADCRPLWRGKPDLRLPRRPPLSGVSSTGCSSICRSTALSARARSRGDRLGHSQLPERRCRRDPALRGPLPSYGRRRAGLFRLAAGA